MVKAFRDLENTAVPDIMFSFSINGGGQEDEDVDIRSKRGFARNGGVDLPFSFNDSLA
jgi:hypothetical protein